MSRDDSSATRPAAEARRAALAAHLRGRLLAGRRAAAAAGRPDATPIREAIRHLVEREAAVLSPKLREDLVSLVVRDTVGLGPLEVLLADTEVDEILVNGHRHIYVERGGRIEPADVAFAGERELADVIERILAGAGRRVDDLNPMADARLADGSRVNVIISPLAVDGASVSIRRFPESRLEPDSLVAGGTMDAEAANLLAGLVAGRSNVLLSGGTGSGKTTMLNAISRFIGGDERIVTIEDAAELSLAHSHVVRLESRPATVEGRGEVTIRDLLRNALRMRPDRIIIGEVRGGEAFDLLNALNTGHGGALSTIHANSCADALARLETLALMAGVGLPHEVVRDQVVRAVDAVVHLERLPEGRRRLAAIDAVEAVEGSDGGFGLVPMWRPA